MTDDAPAPPCQEPRGASLGGASLQERGAGRGGGRLGGEEARPRSRIRTAGSFDVRRDETCK